MRTSLLSLFVPGLLLLAGCSGGSAGTGVSVRCGSGVQFCLVSCDLGCTELGGCSLTQIAENQTLHFVFNQAIDAASVNGSTFSLRTVSGQSPAGDLFLNGSEIIFVPRITTSGGISRFGFTRNESYILTIAGDGSGGPGLKSISGTPLTKDFTCTLTVSLGIIDLDRSPPRSEMLVPTNLTSAAQDTSIVIRFTELIDTAPFVGASTSSIPIRYKLKRARQVGGVFECDPAAQPIGLEGTVRVSVELQGSTPVSVVAMKPSVTLPGQSCVEVEVSGDVRDLAGVAAVPANFQFITATGVIRDFDIPEDFTSPTKLDAVISSGTWNNGARPGLIGGDGRHGSFDASIGTTIATGVYQWNTNNMVIPGNRTLSGQPETVTDGKFYFTDMTLPANTTLRFDVANSAVPPQFYVRGKVDIAGRIEISAPGMGGNHVFKNGSNNVPTNIVFGQPGGLGGVGGARGGKGADRANGVIAGGNIQGGINLNNGQPGEDVRISAGNAYQNRTAGTGGLGSALFPPSGLFTNVTLGIFGVYCGQLSAGGGGGGFNVAGNPGVAQVGATQGTSTLSGPSVGGILFDMMPFPIASPPPGYTSLTHFLTGGSGGGGGGSHPFGGQTTPATTDVFRAGAGGSGGGGCMAVRAGNDLLVRTTAMLEAKGGPGFIFSAPGSQNSSAVAEGLPVPGGGGSGGSWVLQSGGNLLYLGGLDTSGGGGSSINNVTGIMAGARAIGGAGSSGFYRVEAAGTLTFSPSLLPVPAYNVARNSGPLDDRDDVVGCASIWYSTARIFPPDWVRYVLDVDLDDNGTVDVTFSDDPAVAPTAADNLTGPVRIRFQGARVSTTTGQPLQGTTIGPWRDYLSAGAGPSNINADGATGLRMMLQFNRRDFPTAVVKRLSMTYRG